MLKSRCCCRTTLAFDAAPGRNGHCAADLARRRAGRRQTDARLDRRTSAHTAARPSRQQSECGAGTARRSGDCDTHTAATTLHWRRQQRRASAGMLAQAETGGQRSRADTQRPTEIASHLLLQPSISGRERERERER